MDGDGKIEEMLGGPRKMHNSINIFDSLQPMDKIRNYIGQGDQMNSSTKQRRPQIVSMSPSEYTRQLSMTTEERMNLLMTDLRPSFMRDASSDANYDYDFEIVPHMLLFQKYTSGNVYNVSLTIRNTGKVSRYLKLTSDIDPIFIVEYKETMQPLNTRLAPGMYNTYNVRFSPEENRDYEHSIKFSTDRESITIPIIAIGPRPILDFPDIISIPETAVKISSSKSLLVRNLGDGDAIFSLFTSSPYFWLEPSKGVIEEEETVQFVVNFLSNKIGYFEDDLFLRYESGEAVHIRVQCSAIDCNVRLERGSLRMQDETYMGLSTSKCLKIFNRSEYIVKFRWMRYKNDDTDAAEKEKYKKIFEIINNAEKYRYIDLVHYNICMPEAHELVCQRIYADEIASLVNENFSYTDSHFAITPMEGEIWPHGSTDVTVHFEPFEIGEISSTAYLEVTGQEDRISLSLSGISIGPLLKLNVTTIDVENIFLCSLHNYEIVCINKGFIPGTLVHRVQPPDFGGNIVVTPRYLKLQPGQYESFNIAFSSNKNGHFVERVEFVVKESLQVIMMFIRGHVVCPTLHFGKNQLDFGTTALGFTSRQEVMLHNDSLVPVTFSIIVPDDGDEAVVTHEDFAKSPTKPSFALRPREFIVIPNEGIVEAQSSLKVQINFTANVARVGQTILRVDMWDTDSVPVSLPIIFRSIVASIIVKPEDISIRFCFMNYPYSRHFVVENTSEVDGYFYLVPQSISDSTTMMYSMSTHQGYLAPGQRKDVALEIVTRAMGKQKSVVSMLSFGDKVPSTCCVIICNGQGPVVSVQPTSLDFFNINLLEEKTMLLTLISDSPVPAEFTTSLGNKNSPWKVSPISGDLGPGQSIDLRVTIFLRDIGKHNDKIIVTIPNSRTIVVSLNAIGIGSCVVCVPPIFPKFDMGSLFSHQDASLPIEITNQGSRSLKLIFANTMEIRMQGGQMQVPTCEKFSVEPYVIELSARGRKKISCSVRSDKCGKLSEQWWLHCYVEGQTKREIIGNSIFSANFVDPSVTFSKKELFFRIDVSNDCNESLKIDEFFVTNDSGLNLNALLCIESPFGIINDNEIQVQNLRIVLLQNTKQRVRVFFAPKEENREKRYSQTYNGILRLEYEEHPNADKIKCVASVNFPNIAKLPEEIIFNCALGCSVLENIFLKNNGPLEVSYKFVWIKESILVERESLDSTETNDSTLKILKAEDNFEDSEILAETRNLLLGIINDNSFVEETEICVLENLPKEPAITNIVNRICSIVPSVGKIRPYSSQCVSFGFHGIESLSFEGKIACEIDGGASQSINIKGAADIAKLDVDRKKVDFGEQIICEANRETIRLQNLSTIELIYHIEWNEKREDDSLQIKPMTMIIPAKSTIELVLISRPCVPGSYEKSFSLCVRYHIPISIVVQGIAVISQVYVALPRKNLFKEHPVELGYRAIQSLDNSVDYYYENDNEWELIQDDNTLPSIMDIEMAIERLIARNYLQETYFLMNTPIAGARHDCGIPYLFAPEYVLDLGFAVVGETSYSSTRVYNYGSRSARIRLKKPDRANNLAKYGISVHIRDQSPLLPGGYTDLQVSFDPVKLKPPEISSVVKRKFYIEVTNGFTLPILISATVTVPFVTVYPKNLDFREVLIGECLLMHLLIKNEGLIDCSWEAQLPPTRRNQSNGPYCLQNESDIYSPGESGTVRVYFQPQKSGCAESYLTIKMHRNPEPTIIVLRGRGIDHKLRITPSSIDFNHVLPYNEIEGKTFVVENIGQRPIELYWRHLDELSMQEDRLIRILAHYYQVEEILLPVRKPLETWSSQLFDFYNFLIDEMTKSMATQRGTSSKRPFDNDEILEMENSSAGDQAIVNVAEPEISQSRKKSRSTKTRKISRKLSRARSSTVVSSEPNLSIAISSELDILEDRLPLNDPDEMENLLHGFIDELQKQSDFRKTMNDPVKEVFDSLENKNSPTEEVELFSSTKKNKIFMIFHGASSTEYQQAACRTSRILELPLLNLNNAITEMIALGNTVCSAKLRDIIDTKYRHLLSIDEMSNDEKKMFTIEELNSFDSLTRFEYKIEQIENNLEKIGSIVTSRETPRKGKGSAKGSDKNSPISRPKAVESFLDIDLQLLIELLEQRLSMPDLRKGFVLQTLKNRFIANETKVISTLLQIIGDVEYPIFVTFHKSVVSYESENSPTTSNRAESRGEIFEKLTEIDEMSLSEFDILPESEKTLYLEKITRIRSQEALNRRAQFQERLSKLRKQKNLARRGLASQASNRNSNNLAKNKNPTPKSAQPSQGSSKKKSETIESSKSTAQKENARIIADENDTYTSSLESILRILQNWDPTQKPIVAQQEETGRSKISKNPKSKDHPQTISENPIQPKDKFWIWHIKSNDSQNSKISDVIFNELTRNKKILNATLKKSSLKVEPNLRSQIYSVALPKNLATGQYQKSFPQEKAFNLIALKSEEVDSSSETLGFEESEFNEQHEESLESRIVLQPHEFRKFKIHFKPKCDDHFSHEYSLGVVNSTDSDYIIKVMGKGDIPHLDMNPSRIFHKVKESKKDDLNEPTFFEDTGTFHFGSLLLTGKDNRLHRKKTSFKLWNSSRMDLELEVYLMIDDTKVFDVEPKQLLIKPDEFGVINVTAGVTKLGPNENRLILLVKDNPRVEMIELRSDGVKLDLELEGKNISFGRMLLHREINKILKIHNNSTIPIFWRIRSEILNDLQLKFAPLMGWTKARAESQIVFTYLANQVGIMEKCSMSFNVFLNDRDQQEESLFTEIITCTGETYDVAIDVYSANPIDLGTARVGSTTKVSFDIKNRGNYEVKFIIEFEKIEKSTEIDRLLRKNLRDDLEVSPSTGNILPNKMTTINVNFRPKFEMCLQKFPLLRCTIIDANNSATIVAEFPLTVSIMSQYPSFRLIPDSELSFGPMAIFESKTLHLSVENTGIFDIKYGVKNAAITNINVEDSSGKTKKDKSPRSETKKKGTSKSHETTSKLRLGPFILSDDEGSIGPGEVKTLMVDCRPEINGHLEEKMVLSIDEMSEEETKKIILLTVDSYIPSIEFHDLDSIFAESYVVDDIQDFHCPKGIDAHTIFSRLEKCLYFEHVNIHKTHTTSIKLQNRGLVAANVIVSLRPDVLTPTNANPGTFALDTVREHVPAMSTRIFSISFTPSLIETYTGVLEASVELPNHAKSDSHKFIVKLSGEGCVPEVTLIEPSILKITGKYCIRFGRCLVEEKTSRNLCFENVGKISAKIIVGIFNDPDYLFSVRKNIDAIKPPLNLQNHVEDNSKDQGSRSIICHLSTGNVARLIVEFCPKTAGKKIAEIHFHVLDNPYENMTIELDADAFAENVVLENLPIVEISRSSVEVPNKMKKSLKRRSGVPTSLGGSSTTIISQGLSSSALIYKLDFGTCFVGKMSKINFKIVNKSIDSDVRFEFPSHPNVVFVPSIGHLQRSGCKGVEANFFASEPIIHNEATLECTITEIRLPYDRNETHLWDDRQTSVEWIQIDNDDGKDELLGEKLSRKILTPIREPSHEIVAGTWRSIQLIFSAITAYTKYALETREIRFKDTLMFQNRDYTFDVENIGKVDLVFNWKIEIDAGYPMRLPKNSVCSENFRPQSSKSNDSRPSSRSSGGILYPDAEKFNYNRTHSRNERGDELFQPNPNRLNHCRPILSRGKSWAIDVEPLDCSCDPTSDLFSDSVDQSQRSIENWIVTGDNEQSFIVKPEVGVIKPGKSLQFSLRFSPLDVFDYKAYLACQIENLNPDLEKLRILVTARSLLPYCHFDIEESDYLTSGRRISNVDFPRFDAGDFNDSPDYFGNPRVLEFCVVGTGDSHIKEFYLINPTTENYRFTWSDETPREIVDLPYFYCAHENDIAESGKRTKISFSFFAEDIGIHEAFWRFSIDRYKLDTLFILVANVNEPSIKFDKARLKMKPTTVGYKIEDSLTIVNDEDMEFSWKILTKSLHSEDGTFQTINVLPMSGILRPKNQQILQISFLPDRVGDFTFSLKCLLKKMKSPLRMLVTAKVSKIIPRILYSIDNKTQKSVEAYYDRETILDFGKMTLNKSATIKFEIKNIGDVMFHYVWDLGTNDLNYQNQNGGSYFLTISRESEHVPVISESICYLELTVLRRMIIRQHPVFLKIDRGPIYRMFIKASAKHPSIEFSFVNYDFGPCYVRDENSSAYVAQLSVTNNDKTPAIVNCIFENMPHMTVNREELDQAIPGNSTVTISINFRPSEQRTYDENIIFHINESTTEHIVNLKGEGIFYKICLENIRDKFVEFGNVPAGKSVTRKIRVRNLALAPVQVLFDLMKHLPISDELRRGKKSSHEESLVHSKDKKLDNDISLSDFLSIKPENYFLPAGKMVEIIVKFEPTKRMNSFVEKIGAQAETTILPLFFIRGSCVAREFSLDRSHLYFGTIVEGCKNFTKLVLRNNGDFGARFAWNLDKIKPNFDLKPASGYCSPGMDVTFDVTFQPIRLSPMIEAEASIDIEKHSSLTIKCSGACSKIPDAIDILKFITPVRSKQTKNLMIKNDTSVVWNVVTTLNGDYFSVEENFIVPANKSYSCNVIYSPFVMNSETSPHRGRLIVKLPEEKPPLVYNLVGLSLPPEVEGKIVRQLPAKTRYTELLPVHNWSDKSKSFNCDIKLNNDLKMIPVEYSFIGNGKLDVPAHGTRDYRAIFHCYKETILNFRVTFTSDNGEYEFYEIQYKVTKPDILSTIRLTCAARSSIFHNLDIENPLNDRSVTFTANCQHRDITIRNLSTIIPAKSKDVIIIEYSPLIPSESVTKLDVNCPELGNFPYELKLKATVAPQEKNIRVTAMLGSSTSFPITIKNISKKIVEFSIKIDDPSFKCAGKISVPPQKESILNVNYEPCDAKNVRATLRASSESLGEICYPIIGSYILPKPQGPFIVSRNSITSIPFKNVFETTRKFTYILDGTDAFAIGTSSNVIKSKEVTTITVALNRTNDSMDREMKYPSTGKLIIACDDPPTSQVIWIYYLRSLGE